MQALTAIARRTPSLVRRSVPLSRRGFSAAAEALTDEEREMLETPREGMEYDVGCWLGRVVIHMERGGGGGGGLLPIKCARVASCEGSGSFLVGRRWY